MKDDQGGDVFPESDLMTLTSSGDEVATPALPTAMIPDAEIPASEVVQKRTMVFSEDEKSNTFFINDKSFDADRVDVQPKLGTVEEWRLTNTSDEQHPFHKHVNASQVISIDGEPYDAHGLQDTVRSNPRRTSSSGRASPISPASSCSTATSSTTRTWA